MNDDGTTTSASPAEDDSEWMRVPLPERPLLRPLKRWVPERIAGVLVYSVAWLALMGMQMSLIKFAPDISVILTLMVTPGLAIGLFELATLLARRRRAAACRRSPSEPWRHDRMWHERGETRSWAIRVAEAFVYSKGFRFVAVFFAVAVILALTTFRFAWPAGAVASGLGSLLAWRVWRIHGAGDARLFFTKFPYHPGETVTLHFGMSEGGAQFRRVEFSLFHVRDLKGGWLDYQQGTRVRKRIVQQRPPGPLPGPDFDVEVSFDVPASSPGTLLTDKLPSYWVFEVCGATSAGPYVERFLVPIYARPSAPAASGGPAAEADAKFPT